MNETLKIRNLFFTTTQKYAWPSDGPFYWGGGGTLNASVVYSPHPLATHTESKTLKVWEMKAMQFGEIGKIASSNVKMPSHLRSSGEGFRPGPLQSEVW